MDAVIATCITQNYCFDIVTEVFEPAGQSLVNSVSTDCEILSAMTSILSLLLSSNQLLSINKVYDRKRGRAQIIKDKQEEVGALAQTIVDVLTSNDCMFFDGDLDFDDDDFEDDDIQIAGDGSVQIRNENITLDSTKK